MISVRSEEVKPTNTEDTKCAPNIKFDGISCIEIHLLIEMAKAYNDETKEEKDKIKLYPEYETKNTRKYKKYLTKMFKTRMGDKCTTQHCWTEQSFIKKMKGLAREELEKYTFRPNSPFGKFEWLSTINIDEVMTQYEKKHPDFKYLGAVPRDFMKFDFLGIKDYNFKENYDKGIKKIGVVFNTDKMKDSGEHWNAFFADLEKGQIYFFDSYGIMPNEETQELIRITEKFLKSIKKTSLDIRHNNIRHQYKNSECGVYSLNFVISMLDGSSFDDIINKKTSDDEINKYRSVYFRQIKPKVA